MDTSVIICAYTMGRWNELAEAVRSCTVQTLAAAEIIVVVDYNDALFDRAREEFPDLMVIANNGDQGLSGARNTGVAAARGAIIAFLDDDAYAEPEWLERLAAMLEDPKVAGVGGWILPVWPQIEPRWFPQTFYWVLGCSYLGLPEHGATIRNPIGANMAFRHRVFASVGGFSSGLGRIGNNSLGCEETELSIRYTDHFVDERFVLSRTAIVHHRVTRSRLSLRYFLTRCWAEGISKAAVASLVGSRSGLAAERGHLMRALPREIAQSGRGLLRDPRNAASRIGLILVGSGCAVAGLARGKLAIRSAPHLVHRVGVENGHDA